MTEVERTGNHARDVAEAGLNAGPLKAAVLRRSRARRAAKDTAPDVRTDDARVEILGDRIELIEFTLNEYVDRIDALSVHAARLSVDRLEPAVDRLAAAVASALPAPDLGDETAPAGAGAMAATSGSGQTASVSDGLSSMAREIEDLRSRIDALPDRITVAAAPPVQATDSARASISRLFSAVTALARRQDQLLGGLGARIERIETRLDATSDEGSETAQEIAALARALRQEGGHARKSDPDLLERLERIERHLCDHLSQAGRGDVAALPERDIRRLEERLVARMRPLFQSMITQSDPAVRPSAYSQLEQCLASGLAQIETALLHAREREAADDASDIAGPMEPDSVTQILDAIAGLRTDLRGATAVQPVVSQCPDRRLRHAVAELLAQSERPAGLQGMGSPHLAPPSAEIVKNRSTSEI